MAAVFTIDNELYIQYYECPKRWVPYHHFLLFKKKDLIIVKKKKILDSNVPSLDQLNVNDDIVCSATKDGQPSTEYAVMIDAGSSGSRVHVYRFNVCNDPVLEDEVFHMLEPGLSSFKDDAEGAANSLKPLMEIAVKSVPEEHQKCTPIAVKATAGLRMLGADKSDRILASVRKYLETYPFPIAGDNGIEIMEGKDEGKCDTHTRKQINFFV